MGRNLIVPESSALRAKEEVLTAIEKKPSGFQAEQVLGKMRVWVGVGGGQQGETRWC